MTTQLFISWSGPLSQKIAIALHGWVPSVLQSVEPFLSSEDIEKGERWSDHIAEKLQSCGFGVIVLTKDNLVAPWILFEAGALSKMVTSSRVAPLLVNIDRVDVRLPLSQFQSALLGKDDICKLILAINKIGETPVSELTLLRSFEALWPEFERLFTEIIENNTQSCAPAEPSMISDNDSIKTSVGELSQSIQSLREDFKTFSAQTRNFPRQGSAISSRAIVDFDQVLDTLASLGPDDKEVAEDDSFEVWNETIKKLKKVRDHIKVASSRDQMKSDAEHNYLARLLGPASTIERGIV